jgi:formylglycine-generating enzyme required for sulfatase activity
MRGHGFAIAATEVTVRDFLAFKQNHRIDASAAPTPDCPVNSVTWYDTAAYCNWLSKEEGIPESEWCYELTQDGVLEFVPDYARRLGYRLPTESEWEFACKAGAQTAWCFGNPDPELAGCYARWFGNCHAQGNQSCAPVGAYKPNDWGLFDMHGNVAEWCQESPMPGEGENIQSRGRGGYYFSDYFNIGADRRFQFLRTMSHKGVGFRPVRTLAERDKKTK